MLKAKKSYNFKNIGISIIVISVIIGFSISIYRNEKVEVLNENLIAKNEKNSKGFEDIKSINITKLETVDGESKVKWEKTLDETQELKSIMNILGKKEELLNQNYCAIVYNRLTINKVDGSVIEYGMLIGEKVIIIYDGDLKYRIEDYDSALKLRNLFEE